MMSDLQEEVSQHLALGVSNCRPPDAVRAAVSAALVRGPRRVFLAEDVGCRDSFALAGMLAADHGGDLDITISVTNPYLRSPLALAESVLTVWDVIAAGTGRRPVGPASKSPERRSSAPGRSTHEPSDFPERAPEDEVWRLRQKDGAPVRLGLGSSSRGVIAGQLGLDYGSPIRVIKESVTAIRAHLLRLAPESRFPIVLAAMGPRMLRLAGAVADEVLLNTGTTPPYVTWAREQIALGAADAGRDPAHITIAVWVPLYVGSEAREERFTRARLWAASMLSIPGQGELLLEHAGLSLDFLPGLREVHGAYPHTGNQSAGADLVPTEVVEALAVVDSPGGAILRLQQLIASGAETIVLAPKSLETILDAAL